MIAKWKLNNHNSTAAAQTDQRLGHFNVHKTHIMHKLLQAALQLRQSLPVPLNVAQPLQLILVGLSRSLVIVWLLGSGLIFSGASDLELAAGASKAFLGVQGAEAQRHAI